MDGIRQGGETGQTTIKQMASGEDVSSVPLVGEGELFTRLCGCTAANNLMHLLMDGCPMKRLSNKTLCGVIKQCVLKLEEARLLHCCCSVFLNIYFI